MNKSKQIEPIETVTATPAPQSKRYDEALQKAAVENWIQRGKPGTQSAAELGISYPRLKDWKARYYGDATPERDTLAAENRARKRARARVSRAARPTKKTVGLFPEPSSNATKPLNTCRPNIL